MIRRTMLPGHATACSEISRRLQRHFWIACTPKSNVGTNASRNFPNLRDLDGFVNTRTRVPLGAAQA